MQIQYPVKKQWWIGHIRDKINEDIKDTLRYGTKTWHKGVWIT